MQLYRTDVYVVIFTYKFISMVNYTRLATVNMYIYLHIYIYIHVCVFILHSLQKHGKALLCTSVEESPQLLGLCKLAEDDCLVAADGSRVDFMFSGTLLAKMKLGLVSCRLILSYLICLKIEGKPNNPLGFPYPLFRPIFLAPIPMR